MMSSRNNPSLVTLTNNDDTEKSNVRRVLIRSNDIMRSEDVAIIHQFIKNLKESSKKYFDTSRALSKWYQDRASGSAATEVRIERLIIHEDVDGTIKSLNSRIEEIGGEIASNLESLSTVASVPDDAVSSKSSSREATANNLIVPESQQDNFATEISDHNSILEPHIEDLCRLSINESERLNNCNLLDENAHPQNMHHPRISEKKYVAQCSISWASGQPKFPHLKSECTSAGDASYEVARSKYGA